MPWPFSRRRKTPGRETSPEKILDEADREVLMQLVEWVRAQAGYDGELVEDAVHVREASQVGGPPVIVAHARKGKLVRLEVRDQAPRSLVDGLVRAFEKKGLWSFNGVVRSVEGEDP